MPDKHRDWIRLTDDDGYSLYAIWSQSRHRLIVTAESKTQQVLLTPEHVAQLAAFIARTSSKE